MGCVEFWRPRQMMGLRNPVYLCVNQRLRLQRARWFTQIYIELHNPGGWRTTIRQNSSHVYTANQTNREGTAKSHWEVPIFFSVPWNTWLLLGQGTSTGTLFSSCPSQKWGCHSRHGTLLVLSHWTPMSQWDWDVPYTLGYEVELDCCSHYSTCYVVLPLWSCNCCYDRCYYYY